MHTSLEFAAPEEFNSWPQVSSYKEGGESHESFHQIIKHLRNVSPGEQLLASTINAIGTGLLLLRHILIEQRIVCAHCDAINTHPESTGGVCVRCGAPLGRSIEKPE
jgi:hypothetical protein